MSTIGERLKELRVVKGYAQEELAMRSGVSIRTIQRIEKGETIPRGNTLQMLCEVLDEKVEALYDRSGAVESTTLGSSRILYFLILLGLVVPLGNILGPLIGWSIRRKNSVGFDVAGKNIVLTQVVYTVLTTGLVLYAVFTKLGNSQSYVFEWFIGLVFVLGVLNYGLALYAGIKEREERKLYLPFFRVSHTSLGVRQWK